MKKEAFRRTGITYHEVVAGQTTPMELRRLVERLLVGCRQSRQLTSTKTRFLPRPLP